MSMKDGKDRLYLIWKSDKSRKQYVVGELTKNGGFEFHYKKEELEEALADGFKPLLCFEDFDRVYTNTKLFPVFSSRLPDRKRKDIEKILEKYNLKEYDAYLLLKRSGGRLPIDNFEFIDPILDKDKKQTRIFCIAGARHYLGCVGEQCENSIQVTRGDEVLLERDIENQHDKNAVKILTEKKDMLGYLPRYYSESVSYLLLHDVDIVCHIYSVDKGSNCNECIRIKMDINHKR